MIPILSNKISGRSILYSNKQDTTMGPRFWGIFFLLILSSLKLLAQEEAPSKYDFLLAGKLLRDGDAEIKIFNALYHQNNMMALRICIAKVPISAAFYK